MAIDPPYRLDPLQNVVNVKWQDETRGFSWTFSLDHGTAGAQTCSVGGSLVPYETSISLSLLPNPPPSGWSFSVTPSVAPSFISYGANEFAGGVFFVPSLQSGTGSGSANFQLNGLVCGGGAGQYAAAGTVTLTVPAIILTITEGETSTEWMLTEWDASAAAGITLIATFEPA